MIRNLIPGGTNLSFNLLVLITMNGFIRFLSLINRIIHNSYAYFHIICTDCYKILLNPQFFWKELKFCLFLNKDSSWRVMLRKTHLGKNNIFQPCSGPQRMLIPFGLCFFHHFVTSSFLEHSLTWSFFFFLSCWRVKLECTREHRQYFIPIHLGFWPVTQHKLWKVIYRHPVHTTFPFISTFCISHLWQFFNLPPLPKR